MSGRIRGTFEWAKYNENCMIGCSNNCEYCYARSNAVKNNIRSAEDWELENISKKAMAKIHTKRNGRIMFPTRHDITPSNLSACALYLERMLKVGNEVLVVSKPHIGCITFLCNAFTMYKNQMLFRFTIGSAHNEVLTLWEPNAPKFEERVASLELAYRNGYRTSVSCEPMLDDEIHIVIGAVRAYVTDAIWLGKANDLINRMTNNGASDTMIKAGRELVELQNDKNILDLYEIYKDDPIIKWKESIKEVVGLELPKEKGLDE